MNGNIVFDLDGTLIDSAPDIQRIANGLLAARGLDPIDLETTRRFIGKGAANFIEQLRVARGIAESESLSLLDEFVANYDTAVELTHPYTDVEAALCRLAEDYQLGICTNKPYRPCLAVLKHLKLDKFFTSVVGGDSLPVLKPNPLPLLTAFEKMGPGPRVYVGDSEIDAETAAATGVPFILFSRGYRKSPIERFRPAAVFEEFAMLPKIVGNVLCARRQ